MQKFNLADGTTGYAPAHPFPLRVTPLEGLRRPASSAFSLTSRAQLFGLIPLGCVDGSEYKERRYSGAWVRTARARSRNVTLRIEHSLANPEREPVTTQGPNAKRPTDGDIGSQRHQAHGSPGGAMPWCSLPPSKDTGSKAGAARCTEQRVVRTRE